LRQMVRLQWCTALAVLCAAHLVVSSVGEAQADVDEVHKDHSSTSRLLLTKSEPKSSGTRREVTGTTGGDARSRGTVVEPTGKVGGTNQVQELAAAYVEEPSPENLQKLRAATEQKMSADNTAGAEKVAEKANEVEKALAKREEAVQRQAKRRARKVERAEEKLKAINKAARGVTAPDQQARFAQLASAAQKILKSRRKQEKAAQAQLKVAKKVKAVKETEVKKDKKAVKATMSIPEATSLSQAAQKDLALARANKAAAQQQTRFKQVDEEITGLKDAQQAEVLLKKLSSIKKRAQAALKQFVEDDADTESAKQTEQLKVKYAEQAIQRIQDKIRVFNAEAETVKIKAQSKEAEKELEKTSDAAKEAAVAEKKLEEAKKREEKEEERLAEKKKKMSASVKEEAAQAEEKAEKELDGALKNKVKAEQDALAKARAAGDAPKALKVLEKVDEQEIQKKQDKAEKKEQEQDIKKAEDALKQAQKQYNKEKIKAEEDMKEVAPDNKMEAEIMKLQETAEELIARKDLDKMRKASFAYKQMKAASRGIKDAQEATDTLLKRQVVGMVKDSKMRAQKVVKSAQAEIESQARSDVVKLTAEANKKAQQDLGEVRSEYDKALKQLLPLRSARHEAEQAEHDAQEKGYTPSEHVTRNRLMHEQMEAEQAHIVRQLRQKLGPLVAKAKFTQYTNSAANKEKMWKNTNKQMQAAKRQKLGARFSLTQKTSARVGKIITALKTGSLEKAQKAVDALKDVKSDPTMTVKNTKTLTAAMKHLQEQIVELGDIEEEPAAVVASQSQKHQGHTEGHKGTASDTKVASYRPNAEAADRLSEEHRLQISVDNSEQALESDKMKLSAATKKLTTLQEKLVTVDAETTNDAQKTVAALESKLEQEKMEVQLANDTLSDAKTTVKESRKVISQLEKEQNNHRELEAFQTAQAESLRLNATHSRLAESVLGKKAAKTLEKLQTAEKESSKVLQESKSVSLKNSMEVKLSAEKSVETIQVLRDDLAQQLIDLRESDVNSQSKEKVANEARVRLEKAKYMSKEQQLKQAKEDFSKSIMAQQKAEDEFKVAMNTMKATETRLEEVKSAQISKMVSKAGNAKRTAASLQKIREAARASDAAKLSAAEMKSEQEAAATALSIKIERQKAADYQARARKTAKRAEQLMARANRLTKQVEDMGVTAKEKAAHEQKRAAKQEAKAVDNSQADIKKAKADLKAAENSVEQSEGEKEKLQSGKKKEDGIQAQLSLWKQKKEALLSDKVDAMAAKAKAAKHFREEMVAYAVNNVGPNGGSEKKSLRKKLKSTSKSEAANFVRKYGADSLRVQVAAAQKHVADLKAHKIVVKEKHAAEKVKVLEKRLEVRASKNEKEQVEYAKQVKEQVADAKKMQSKLIRKEKRDFGKIAKAQAKAERKKKGAMADANPASLQKLKQQAAQARGAALRIQEVAKTQAKQAQAALEALKKTLQDSAQRTEAVQRVAKESIQTQQHQVNSGAKGSTKELKESVHDLKHVRRDVQARAKLVDDYVSQKRQNTDHLMKHGTALVDRVAREVHSMEEESLQERIKNPVNPMLP